MPIFGVTWHHHDLVSIYNKLKTMGYEIIYLTARSYSDYDNTRSYIDGVVHGKEMLPRGPILMSPKSFFTTLRADMVVKNADVRTLG